MIWKPFYLTCIKCGHKNRPHKSPKEGVRQVLLNSGVKCNGCGDWIKICLCDSDRPLVIRVREELKRQNQLPLCPEHSMFSSVAS